MYQPPSFTDFAKHNYTYKLRKASYGLKGALYAKYFTHKQALLIFDFFKNFVIDNSHFEMQAPYITYSFYM